MAIFVTWSKLPQRLNAKYCPPAKKGKVQKIARSKQLDDLAARLTVFPHVWSNWTVFQKFRSTRRTGGAAGMGQRKRKRCKRSPVVTTPRANNWTIWRKKLDYLAVRLGQPAGWCEMSTGRFGVKNWTIWL